MYKKRGDGSSFSYFGNRKAQVTVFIIIGILIMVSFLFVISLSGQVKKDQLLQEKDKAFSQLFNKEGMRLYVEDCLQDELKGGIEILGKQGKLWRGQNPGGVIEFTDKTGVTDAEGNNVFYALKNKEYTIPNAYPCDDSEEDPEFCQYKYPNTSLDFGKSEISPDSIGQDLKRFIADRTIWCVENFTKENISSQAKIEPAELDISLTLEREGINVIVEYPLKFSVGEKDLFTLSTFDFFYPTKLKQLFDEAVYFPLLNDRDFVDFDYSENTLLNGEFSYGSPKYFENKECEETEEGIICKRRVSQNYPSLGISMNKNVLDNGDNLFTFSLGDERYSFARQNRPPALNYVGRFTCPSAEYDYLVIKDDEHYGDIDIDLFALDPDEEDVVFEFDELNTGLVDEDDDEDKFLVSKDKLVPGEYEIIANVSDQHEDYSLSDWQNVRIVVDHSLTSTLALITPYKDINLNSPYGEIYFVSPEDPITLNVILPETSLTEGREEVELTYTVEGKPPVVFDLIPDREVTGTTDTIFEFQLPYSETATANLIEDIEEENEFLYHPFFDEGVGELKVNFQINYCDQYEQPKETIIPVAVRQCLPHRNADHPFPYPNEEYVDYDRDGLPDPDPSYPGEYIKEPLEDPFQANHTCCFGDINIPEGNWAVAEDSTVCFREAVDELGCYGKEYDLGEGYLLEKRTFKVKKCDGQRGNICGDEEEYESEKLDEIKCGNGEEHNSCNKVAPGCYNKFPWFKGNSYWCNGPVGCGDERSICDTEIVDKVGTLGFSTTVIKANHAQYNCGCEGVEVGSEFVGKPCFNFETGVPGTCVQEGMIFKDYYCK